MIDCIDRLMNIKCQIESGTAMYISQQAATLANIGILPLGLVLQNGSLPTAFLHELVLFCMGALSGLPPKKACLPWAQAMYACDAVYVYVAVCLRGE